MIDLARAAKYYIALADLQIAAMSMNNEEWLAALKVHQEEFADVIAEHKRQDD